jgi:hypothetical protein
MNTIYHYLLILVGCAAILFGIQVPNFVDQYEKRLDAHLSEVRNNLAGYQQIADKFFGGSMAALIAKHEQSVDETFRQEARPIRNIFERYQRFAKEKSSLATGLPGKIASIIAAGDQQLLDETLADYSFTIPLNESAIYSGFIVMVIVVFIIELLRIALLKIFGLSHRAEARR